MCLEKTKKGNQEGEERKSKKGKKWKRKRKGKSVCVRERGGREGVERERTGTKGEGIQVSESLMREGEHRRLRERSLGKGKSVGRRQRKHRRGGRK